MYHRMKVRIAPSESLFCTRPGEGQEDTFDRSLHLNSSTMPNRDFTMTLLVSRTPQEVFEAVSNVRGWWSENIAGTTGQLSAEWLYHYKDVHSCKIGVVELIPGKRVVWRVLENHFSFTSDGDEWKGNELVFDISPKGGRTQLVFTQHGLTPAYECYNVCSDAWTGFIGNSLRKLITTGKGEPTPKDRDGAFNEALIRKWGLNGEQDSAGFSFSFLSAKSAGELFEGLVDIRKWWTGLYNESIEGDSRRPGDEFAFRAGDGAHYSKQKLVELVPGEKVEWRITDSALRFEKPDEWTGTSIGFQLSETDAAGTKVTFHHRGLVPAFDCYDGCSGAWTAYLERLAEKMK